MNLINIISGDSLRSAHPITHSIPLAKKKGHLISDLLHAAAGILLLSPEMILNSPFPRLPGKYHYIDSWNDLWLRAIHYFFLTPMPKSFLITFPKALKNPGMPSRGLCGGSNVLPLPPPRDDDDDDAKFLALVEYAACVAFLCNSSMWVFTCSKPSLL